MALLKKNDIYTVTINGYTSEGLGVARVDNAVVFIKGALNGEVCSIRIVKVGKNVSYGKLERIIAPSPHRALPSCDIYGKCGGCNLYHMDYEEELRFKRQRVDDAFSRIGRLAIRTEDIIGADISDGYRNKTICSLGKLSDCIVTGFYRERSHDIVPFESCMIENDYSNRAVKVVRDWANKYNIPIFNSESRKGLRRVFTRYGVSSNEGQVVIVAGNGLISHENELISAITTVCPETVSIMKNINPAPGDTVLSDNYKLIWGRDTIDDNLCGLDFCLAPGAFYQINHDQAEKLYAKALEYATLDSNSTALDLYCGTGTITLCMAKRAKQVIGIEIVQDAVENARHNAERNNIKNVRFICSDAAAAASTLKKEGFSPDVVIVDPPRKGLSEDCPEIIASMSPNRIVYVSCNPATLARDLKIFSDLGYIPQKAAAVDMFPRTSHVESVVLLSRA